MPPPPTPVDLPLQGLLEDLQALRQQAPRSNIAWLRKLFEPLEAVRKEGVPRRLVFQTLQQHGLTMTLKSFDVAMTRIRKERGLPRRPRTEAPPTDVGRPRRPEPQRRARPDVELPPALPNDAETGRPGTWKEQGREVADPFLDAPPRPNPLLRHLQTQETSSCGSS